MSVPCPTFHRIDVGDRCGFEHRLGEKIPAALSSDALNLGLTQQTEGKEVCRSYLEYRFQPGTIDLGHLVRVALKGVPEPS